MRSPDNWERILPLYQSWLSCQIDRNPVAQEEGEGGREAEANHCWSTCCQAACKGSWDFATGDYPAKVLQLCSPRLGRRWWGTTRRKKKGRHCACFSLRAVFSSPVIAALMKEIHRGTSSTQQIRKGRLLKMSTFLVNIQLLVIPAGKTIMGQSVNGTQFRALGSSDEKAKGLTQSLIFDQYLCVFWTIFYPVCIIKQVPQLLELSWYCHSN